jgi:integrase
VSRVLGRGPWMAREPVSGGYRMRATWEELDGDVVRRVGRSLGLFKSKRDPAVWEALDRHYEEIGLVLPPVEAVDEDGAGAAADTGGRARRGVRSGQVLNPDTRRMREGASARWRRQQALQEAAGEAARRALAGADGAVALPEGLPEGATVIVLLPGGQRVTLGAPPVVTSPVAAAATPATEPPLEPRESGGRRRHTARTWLLSKEFDAYLRRDYARSHHRRTGQLRQLAEGLPEVALDELEPRHVDSYKTWRRYQGKGGQGCSATTVRIELETLKVALRHAQTLGLVDRVIEWSRPRWKSGRRKRIAWSLDEYARALHVSRPPELVGVTRGHPPLTFSRDIRLQILLGVDGLLRPGEILHTAWDDVDLTAESPTLHVCSKPSVGWWIKTERDDSDRESDRWIPLTPRLAQALRERWLRVGRPREGWVFPGAKDATLPATTFKKALARVCEQAGVRVIRPVELRHTGATIASRHLGFTPDDLMAVGGWTSPQIPYSVYVKRDIEGAARKMSGQRPQVEAPGVIDRTQWVSPKRRGGM